MRASAAGARLLASMLAVAPAGATQSADAPDVAAALIAADPVVRARAACALRQHSDRAAAAVGALGALLSDGSPVESEVCEQRWWRGDRNANTTTPGELAAAALVAAGSRSVSVLEGALKSPSWIARRNAAWALGALEERRAVSALLGSLRDAEAQVREQSAWALGVLEDRDAVEPLIDALKDSDPRVRRQAAWALGVIEDSRATSPLVALLKDEEASVRAQAAWALGIIGR